VMTATLASVTSLLTAYNDVSQFSLWYLHQRYTGSDILLCTSSFYRYRVDDYALLSWFYFSLQDIKFILLHMRNCDPLSTCHSFNEVPVPSLIMYPFYLYIVIYFCVIFTT
jgi:hypothetical protein